MLAIALIFTIVFETALAPILFGLDDVIIYGIKKTKINGKAKTALSIICNIVFCLIALIAIFSVWRLSEYLCSFDVGKYVAVIVYTILLTIISSTTIYHSPKKEITNAWEVYKNGFTRANINNIIPRIPLKAIINIFYVLALIFAQIEDLGFCTFPDEVSYFFTLNKYGIVIVLAIEKILKSFKPDLERAKILSEAFAVQERQDEEERAELKKSFKELKELIKLRKQARKEAKEQRKKERDKK